MPAPQLAAYYWTGAAPAPHSVQDISLNGLFLLTGERWYPGTHLMLALQAAADTQDKTVKSLTVQAKVVRWGNDGVGLEFVLPEHNGPNGARVFEEHTADRRSLEKYLKEIRNMNASAAVHYVISSEAGSKSAD
jgi:hypothetical protein